MSQSQSQVSIEISYIFQLNKSKSNLDSTMNMSQTKQRGIFSELVSGAATSV